MAQRSIRKYDLFGKYIRMSRIYFAFMRIEKRIKYTKKWKRRKIRMHLIVRIYYSEAIPKELEFLSGFIIQNTKSQHRIRR